MNTSQRTEALSMAQASRALSELYPDAACELVHSNAFELLVATVLSAQTTDVRVNQVTPELWRRFADVWALANADQSEVEEIVRPLGMGARRAHQLVSLSAQLVRDHGGEVPDDQAALESLAGVGRKTAHVVRGTWFGHSLLTVDTHVGRLARRFGWSEQRDPRKVEEDVVTYSGADARCADTGGASNIDLTLLSHQMILHGRRVCSARNPACQECALATLATPCPRIGVGA